MPLTRLRVISELLHFSQKSVNHLRRKHVWVGFDIERTCSCIVFLKKAGEMNRQFTPHDEFDVIWCWISPVISSDILITFYLKIADFLKENGNK